MKKYIISIAVFIAVLFSGRLFSQTSAYPFEVKGSGKGDSSIIFIPGFGCSGEVWNETKTLFENKFTCYTLTMAGFAGAAPQPGPTFVNWEQGIANFIKDKKIVKPVIIGHSMGGGLALALAADYPQLVSKIVVVDALPCLAALRNPGFKASANPGCEAASASITKLTDQQFYEMQKNYMPMLMTDTTKISRVVEWSVKSDRKTFGLMFCDFSNTDLREKIATVQCPALILLEANFKNIKTNVDAQYKNCLTAQLHYADKGLHFIMYDDKEWYNNELKDFIK